MAASSTDTGITELDKLIHSLEFENQQYVKMIEKETQLISSVESQIEEKIQQTLKLEQDISRIDEDTRRLHRLYTNNRENIESLRNTINVLSDHETALSRQLEVTRSKTEDSRKFYEAQLTNYSNIRDDYMKKYSSFPLAIELEKKKQALTAAQRQLDNIMAIKQDLEGRLSAKEDDLDSKIMTRIVVKIAKTQLATVQLRQDINERLAEKAGLAEKLKEIRTTEHTGQDEQCRENDQDIDNVLSMEIDDLDHMEDSHRQNSRDEVEGFSNMSITDSQQRGPIGDGQQHFPHSDTEELCMKDTVNSHRPEVSNTMQGKHDSGMIVLSDQPWPVLTHDDGGQMFTSTDSVAERRDVNKSAVSDQMNREKVIAEKRPEGERVTHAGDSPMPGSVKVAKLNFPLLYKIRPPPPIHMPVLQNLDKVPEQRMAPEMDTEMTKTTGKINSDDTLKSSWGQIPQICIPRLSRVLPPPAIHIPPIQKQLKVPEQETTGELCTEIKKAPAPVASMLQDLRQKMSLLLPKPAPNSSTQQSQHNSLSKTSDLISTTTERAQVDHRPWSLKFDNTQISQLQTAPTGSSTETLISKQVSGHSTSLPSSQQRPSSETKKVSVEKHNTPLQGIVNMQAKTVETSIKTTDVEVPTKGCESPPSEPDSCQNLFSVNIQGFSCSDMNTQSPKGKYNKSTNRRSPSSEGNHGFLLESLFGNFEKKLNEDNYESDEEAAPTSIFSLFNISQSPGGGANDDPKDVGSFFTFGKFADNAGSPAEGPSNLLNLFTKSQTSDCSSRDFAVNFQDDDKENETTFKFGVAVDKGNESNEEPEKPLFNLF